MSSTYEFDVDRVAGSGIFIKGTAGEVLGKHKLVYMDATGRWQLADADLAAELPVLGLTLAAANTGRKVKILIKGYVGDPAWAWVIGTEIYASSTPGELTQAPAGLVQVVGMAGPSTDFIYFNSDLNTGAGGVVCALLEGATAYVGFDVCKGTNYTNYWTVDGVADNVQVVLALAYISALGGGQLFMEAGGYVFAAQVNVDFSDIQITGAGRETVITYLGNVGQFAFYFNNGGGTRYNVLVEHIKFIGNPAGANNQIISARDITNITTRDCMFEDVGDEAITLNLGTRNGIIKDNQFTNCTAADALGGVIALQSGHHLIEGNTIMGGGLGFGIHLEAIAGTEDIEKVRIKNNEIHDVGDDGVFINASGFDISDVIIEGNHIYDAGDEGIAFNASPGQIIDNINIEDNHIIDSTGVGILNLSAQRVTNVKIVDNTISGSGSDGINTTARGWMINDNDITGNGGDGVELSTGSSHCTLNDNRIHHNDTNGVYLTGSSHNTIEDNQIIDNKADGVGAENGIKLNNDCDDNQIMGNHITTTVATRQEYAIKIVDAASERNRIFDNYMLGNATGCLSDGGTDTITPERFIPVGDSDSNVGDHPTLVLPDTVDTTFRFQAQIPLEFQEFVTSQVIILQTATGGPPDLQWSTTTDWGKLCAGENYNAGSDAETDQTTAVAQNELVCIDVSASLTGIAAGDLVGFTFIRRGSQAGDTIDADAYYLGFRLRYV